MLHGCLGNSKQFKEARDISKLYGELWYHWRIWFIKLLRNPWKYFQEHYDQWFFKKTSTYSIKKYKFGGRNLWIKDYQEDTYIRAQTLDLFDTRGRKNVQRDLVSFLKIAQSIWDGIEKICLDIKKWSFFQKYQWENNVEPNHSEQMQRRELEEPRTDFVFRKFGDVGKNESMIVTRGSYSWSKWRLKYTLWLKGNR